MSGRGWVIPIGGAEEKAGSALILKRFCDLCSAGRGRIAVIPTASELAETGPLYEKLFTELGAKQVRVLPLETRADCERDEWLRKLERADGVFFTGGNQLRLTTTIVGTSAGEVLRRRNAHDGLHVAGTSAGAAFVSEHMIAAGGEGRTPHAGMVTLAGGLGLTSSVIIDQHFRQRGRLGRLLAALAYNPDLIGIGLDEDTAAFIGPDDVFEVLGSGAVTVIDAADVEYTSLDTARDGDPISLTNIRMHVLIAGGEYDIKSRTARPRPAAARAGSQV